jgi:hypothetical protein
MSMPISERCVIDLLITKSVQHVAILHACKGEHPRKISVHDIRYTIKHTGCAIQDTRLNVVRWVDKESNGSLAGLSNGTHVVKHVGCRRIVRLFVNDEMG